MVNYKTIVAEFSNSDCKVEAINGTADHVHILFLLNTVISVDQLIQLTQTDSATIINTECFKAGSFHWQANPLVLSVSESQIPKLAEYIKNQKSIHQSKTLQAEYSEFKKLHSLT